MVKVKIRNNKGDDPEHSEASAINVRDGVLHVVKSEQGYESTVAVYAPDEWKSAVVAE